MWVPLPWVKTSKSSTSTHTKSLSFDTFLEDHSPSFQSQSPIHHNHSPTLKDIHTLLNNPLPPSPLHKHSLSSPAQSPAHNPAQSYHPVSFKDVESLSSSDTHSRKSSIFHRIKTWAQAQTQVQAQSPPDSSNKVVVYFTSLRVVRRTYEDCRAVRSILKRCNVKMDERDLSMDGKFWKELEGIINGKNKELSMSLPRVYVNGKYIGGVDEIRRLHESGELKKVIQGLPLAERGVCKFCGGFRFNVCEWCDGSHRLFVDNKVGFKNCSVCNANGLVLCEFCTCVVFL